MALAVVTHAVELAVCLDCKHYSVIPMNSGFGQTMMKSADDLFSIEVVVAHAFPFAFARN